MILKPETFKNLQPIMSKPISQMELSEGRLYTNYNTHK